MGILYLMRGIQVVCGTLTRDTEVVCGGSCGIEVVCGILFVVSELFWYIIRGIKVICDI